MADAGATLLVSAPPSRPIKVAPWVEFLLVGGGTLVLFPVAWLLRARLGLSTAELVFGFVTFHAAFVINDPHFSVTYLLFYRDARQRLFGRAFPPLQRVRYVVAGVLVPVVLAAWAGGALALHSARALGWLIQLMFLLVGWHYVKQGFGVLAVLCARRGVTFSQRERTALLVHCFAAWAYAWSSPADPGGEFEEKGVTFVSIPHGAVLELTTWTVFVLSALALFIVLVQKARREGRMPPLAPLTAFLATLWLWTVYSSFDPVMLYLIPALHSLQYLYFVWLMRRNEGVAAEEPPEFGRPVALRLGLLAASAVALGWLIFHGAPELLDASPVTRAARLGDPTDALGVTPWLAAFNTVVNLHHYFMDHVIWRRENPETRWLRA